MSTRLTDPYNCRPCVLFFDRRSVVASPAASRCRLVQSLFLFQSEMVLCDTLVSYLETTFIKTDAPKVHV